LSNGFQKLAMMNYKRILFAVSVAAIAGIAVGTFWIVAMFWRYWNWRPKFVTWIAYTTCPFAILDIPRSAYVVIPLLNALLYSLLVYVILRFAKRPAIQTAFMLGYALGVFWVILTDAAMYFHPNWVPDWVWWGYITCPFAYPMIYGLTAIAIALIPLTNALCYLLVYSLLNRLYQYSRRIWNKPTW
jgi:hypothetical protein